MTTAGCAASVNLGSIDGRVHESYSALCASGMLVSVAGCATLRDTDPKQSETVLSKLRGANTLPTAASVIREMADLYYLQIGALRKDIVGSGDRMTDFGIAGGAAAIGDAGVGWFKALGLMVGALGVNESRYKPVQQRQHYLDAVSALSCVADRAEQLNAQQATFTGMSGIPLDRRVTDALKTGGTSEQVLALQAIDTSLGDTFNVVQEVHRKLDNKLLAVSTTQGFAAIRDSLVKEVAQRPSSCGKGQRAEARRSGEGCVRGARESQSRGRRGNTHSAAKGR